MWRKNRFKKLFKRKKIYIKKLYKNFYKKIKKNRLKISIIFFLVISFIASILVIRFTIFHQDYTILSINYNEEDFSDYSDLTLYTWMPDLISNKNYFKSKYIDYSSIIDEIRKDHPIVRSFDMSMVWVNTVYIDFDFYDPDFVFYNWDYNAYYWDSIFELWTWSKLLSWANIVNLPDYHSDLDSFNGIFYKVSAELFTFQTNEIFNFFWEDNIDEIKYIPWASRLIVFKSSWLEINFNLLESVADQLERYYLVNNSYPDYSSIKEIDLWSSNDIIITK